ncbi:Uncharacterized protein ACO02O_10624 [Dirofilaria immitis]
MDHMQENSWYNTNGNENSNYSNNLINDYIFSSSIITNNLCHDDCCCCDTNDNAYYETHYLTQSAETQTTPEYVDLVDDNSIIKFDNINKSLGSLDDQLNLAPNIIDVKIELNNNYSNALETLSPNSSNSSSSEVENNGQFGSTFATEQSFLDDDYHHAELSAYAKKRRKMHEMAVDQKLITEQDPKSFGFLHLSVEEKRALLQEGYTLPTMLPLTKSEEQALKVIRRKIKNKLSAQESRRKRKEYLNALETKIQYYRIENSTLKLKVKDLEQKNQNLSIELRNFKASNRKMEHHSICPVPNITTIIN